MVVSSLSNKTAAIFLSLSMWTKLSQQGCESFKIFEIVTYTQFWPNFDNMYIFPDQFYEIIQMHNIQPDSA